MFHRPCGSQWLLRIDCGQTFGMAVRVGGMNRMFKKLSNNLAGEQISRLYR